MADCSAFTEHLPAQPRQKLMEGKKHMDETDGLVKAAEKSMKALVVRTKKLGENLKQAVACWFNMKRQSGSSPAELFWSRTQRHRVPISHIWLATRTVQEETTYTANKWLYGTHILHSFCRCNLVTQLS